MLLILYWGLGVRFHWMVSIAVSDSARCREVGVFILVSPSASSELAGRPAGLTGATDGRPRH